MKGQHDGRVLLVKEIILRVFAYGLPITIGLLGFILGWWEKLSTGGWTNRNLRGTPYSQIQASAWFPPKTHSPPTGQRPSEWRNEAHRGPSAPSEP